MRFVFVFMFACLLSSPAGAQGKGVDVTMPLVEKTLRFLESRALSPPPESTLLRAGVVRVCGADMSGPGCRTPGQPLPRDDISGPEANLVWRRILESAIAGQSFSEGKDFDKTAFQRYVMDAMVEALGDPSSFYLVPSVYKKIAAIPSDFVGFGLRVVPTEDALLAVAVHPGSPASDASVLLGDRVVRVNGEGVNGYRRPIALAAIWGAYGEKVELAVERRGKTREIEVVYEPWTFTPFSLERHGDVLAVHIRHFETGLVEAVRRELAGSCSGIAFDLRDAASGDENEMEALADLLLGDAPVGSKQMRGDLGNRTWTASAGSDGERLDIPVAVVINGGTSGLAEVLAAALRQANRAILVGLPSAGLDTLETLRPFDDGSAIQVTSTRLEGPSGSNIADGVLPHLKTERVAVVELAVKILQTASSSDMDSLIEAARSAVSSP